MINQTPGSGRRDCERESVPRSEREVGQTVHRTDVIQYTSVRQCQSIGLGALSTLSAPGSEVTASVLLAGGL